MVTYSSITSALHDESVVLYPTEAVWGLGCDPFSEKAVQHLLALKGRSVHRGLILLVSDWEQVNFLVDSQADIDWRPIRASWPGPVTWVFPVSSQVPGWLQHANGTIALRMPSYVLLQTLLRDWGHPLVSTSANKSDQSPCQTREEAESVFPGLFCHAGVCEGKASVSAIFDSITGRSYRD